jgi:hypothetical protein
MDDKPCGRLWSDVPRVVALVATDLATRILPRCSCKSRAKRKKGTKRACRAGNAQKRPVAWSESPQWVERIAPVGGAIRTTTYGGYEAIRPAPPRPWGQPSATRSASSARSSLYRPHSPQAKPTALNDFAT